MSHLAPAVVLVAALFFQDFDKAKHPWLKWKKGSSVSYKMSIDAGGQTFDITSKHELKDIGDKEYAILETSEMLGQPQESEHTNTLPVKDGEETLKIDGKEYKCVIWKQTRSGSRSGESRFWIADGVDGPLKVASKAGREESELTAVKVKDEVEVGGKKYSCVKLEGKFAGGQMGEMKGTLWFSLDIPAGLAKMDLEGEKGSMKMVVTEFDGKK